jgi:hypothetical protein
MDILKGPSKAVLDGSIFNKIILVFVNKGDYLLLESIGQQLSDDFHATIEEGNWPEVRN